MTGARRQAAASYFECPQPPFRGTAQTNYLPSCEPKGAFEVRGIAVECSQVAAHASPREVQYRMNRIRCLALRERSSISFPPFVPRDPIMDHHSGAQVTKVTTCRLGPRSLTKTRPLPWRVKRIARPQSSAGVAEATSEGAMVDVLSR